MSLIIYKDQECQYDNNDAFVESEIISIFLEHVYKELSPGFMTHYIPMILNNIINCERNQKRQIREDIMYSLTFVYQNLGKEITKEYFDIIKKYCPSCNSNQPDTFASLLEDFSVKKICNFCGTIKE